MLKLSLLQKFKNFAPVAQQEKRIRPRHFIKGTIRYRTHTAGLYKAGRYEEGVLHELSQTGLLLSTRSALTIGTKIHLIVTSRDDSYHPVHIIAKVVRQACEITDAVHAYGCEIEEYHDTN